MGQTLTKKEVHSTNIAAKVFINYGQINFYDKRSVSDIGALLGQPHIDATLSAVDDLLLDLDERIQNATPHIDAALSAVDDLLLDLDERIQNATPQVTGSAVVEHNTMQISEPESEATDCELESETTDYEPESEAEV